MNWGEKSRFDWKVRSCFILENIHIPTTALCPKKNNLFCYSTCGHRSKIMRHLTLNLVLSQIPLGYWVISYIITRMQKMEIYISENHASIWNRLSFLVLLAFKCFQVSQSVSHFRVSSIYENFWFLISAGFNGGQIRPLSHSNGKNFPLDKRPRNRKSRDEHHIGTSWRRNMFRNWIQSERQFRFKGIFKGFFSPISW